MCAETTPQTGCVLFWQCTKEHKIPSQLITLPKFPYFIWTAQHKSKFLSSERPGAVEWVLQREHDWLRLVCTWEQEEAVFQECRAVSPFAILLRKWTDWAHNCLWALFQPQHSVFCLLLLHFGIGVPPGRREGSLQDKSSAGCCESHLP